MPHLMELELIAKSSQKKDRYYKLEKNYNMSLHAGFTARIRAILDWQSLPALTKDET